MANSRQKGNKAERKAAQLFKTWTKRDFARTPSSGGLQWKTTNSKGDIVCTKEGHYFPFCIEVKNYKFINFNELILPDKKNKDLLIFWAQAKRDAEKAKKIPLLLFRYNGLPSEFFFIIIPCAFYRKIRAHIESTTNCFKFYADAENLMIVHPNILFNTNYNLIHDIAKKYLKHG